MRPSLGAFELGSVLGSGGGAVVWEAVHRTEGVRVAVKVLHARFARNPALLQAFSHEVAAMARLDHPAIATVFDFGTVDPAVSRATGGEVAAGAPWLALELASGGTLADPPNRPGSWAELAALLQLLLDALAHAHARGVVHRDLKPGNLLVRTAADHRAGPMIADFGIASLPGTAPPDGTATAGTPRYAAPEQFDGAWQAFGPWTDLYALGATVRHLLDGRHVDAGPLLPRFPVPEAFAGWLAKATAPEPADRFRSAAEALRALPTRSRARPRRWPAPAPLLAAGLPLFDLREPRFVGRERERRALAAAWHAVAARRRPRRVELVGPPGVGRSALLRWIRERAVESGGVALAVAPDPDGRAVERALRRFAAEARLGLALPEEALPAEQALALAARAVGEVAAKEPVLVTVDDLPLAPDAAPLVRALLALGDRPVLVVTVGGTAGLPPADTAIPVRPMTRRALARALVEQLPLDGAAAVALAAAADGRIAHGRLLLAHAVRAGELARRGGHWTLTRAAPPSFDALRPQVEAVIAAAGGEAARLPLLLAAALGPRVPKARWRRACATDDATCARLLAALVERGLVEKDADGFEHLHPSFRRAVLERAAADGLAREVHARCADALRAEGVRAGAARLQLGRHEHAAGRPEARETLARAARELVDDARFDLALAALDLYAEGGADRACRLERIGCLLHLGDAHAARAEALALADEARAAGDRLYESAGLRSAAVAELRLERTAEALLLLGRALEVGEGTSAGFNALETRFMILLTLHSPEAEGLLPRLEAAAAALGPYHRLAARQCRGELAWRTGDRAGGYAILAEVAADPGCDPVQRRILQVQLGDLARALDRPEDARRHYEAAARELTPFVEGGTPLFAALLDLAMLALEGGRAEEARGWLAALAERTTPAEPGLQPLVDVVTCACAARLGDWPEAAARLERVARGKDLRHLAQRDTVLALRIARDAALAAGRAGFAEDAERLAAELAARMG